MLRTGLISLIFLVTAPALAQTPAPDNSRSCLPLGQIKRSKIIDASTIMFQVGSRWYRNTITPACYGLDDRQSLVNHIHGSNQLCSGDSFDAIDSAGGVPRAACVYGRFTPSDPPPKAQR